MPPLTPVQNTRKTNVNKYTALYNKYISPILGSKPITLKEKDIDKYVSDEKNYQGFAEAQNMVAAMESKQRYAVQLQGRNGFKERLLQNEMLPLLPNMNLEMTQENVKHNNEILKKYEPGEEGDKNELEKLQKYWSQLLRAEYGGLSFRPEDKPIDTLRKLDNLNLLFNVETLNARLIALGHSPKDEEFQLLRQKRMLVVNSYQLTKARIELAGNYLAHSIPGVDWTKMSLEDLNKITTELSFQTLNEPENKELADFLEIFKEMSNDLIACKTQGIFAQRQTQVFKYLHDNAMFTNHGVNALCYDMDGNPIADPMLAIDEYVKADKAFIVVHNGDFVNAGAEDKFGVFTIDKNGNVAIENADPAKYPNIYQKRLEQYQQKIVEQANEAHKSEMQQREAEIRKAAEEKEKAEQQKIEADKLKAQQDAERLKAQQDAEKIKEQQNAENIKEDVKPQLQPEQAKKEELIKEEAQPQQIKKEEPKKEEPKQQEEPIFNPDEGDLLKNPPQYKDPFVVPEMKSEQLTKKLIKDRYNAAVNINKELNSYYPKMNKFPFDKEEYTQLAMDQNRFDAHKYAKQFVEFIDSIKTPNLPSLQGLPVNKLSNLVPADLKDKPAKDILKYFVSRAYNADLSWLMNVNDDVNLAKNMAKHYSDLQIAGMGREIIESAQRENIKLEIPDEIKNTILNNAELMNKKLGLSMARISLLADETYSLMPDFEAHNVESFMAAVYGSEIAQQNIQKGKQLSPLVATFNTYANALSNQESNQKEIDVNKQLYNDGVLTDLNVDSAEFFVLGSKPVKKSYAEVIKALGEGRSVAVFQNPSHLGSVMSLDEDGKLEVEQRQRYAVIGDVEPTDPEKRYEVKYLENKKKQARVKKIHDERRESLENLSARISSKALNGVPQAQWPKDIDKDYYSGEARVNVNKNKWNRIKNNIDDYISTDEEIAQQIDAKEQLALLKKHKTIEPTDASQAINEKPWMMYQLFKAPLPETPENKAKNEEIDAYNSTLYDDIDFTEAVYEKFNELSADFKAHNTKENKKAFSDYHDELLANPVKYVKNPNRAKEVIGELFQKVITECNPEWFDDLTDEKMIEDWSKKAPYFELLTNDQFIKNVKNWGVKISPHDIDVFDTEKILLTEKIAALNRKMQALAKPYYKEFDNLKLNKNELRLAGMSSKMYDRYTDYEILSVFVESTQRGSEKADKLIDFLKSMDCYVADLNNLSNGKVFCNKNGVTLTVGDALERIRQDAGKPINKRVSDNVVFVMDHTAKTCKRVCLDEKGDYSCTDGNYKEMLEASKLSESKSVAVDNTKLLKENQLGVKQTISALERYKKKFDNTDFWPFVKNRKQITDMRKQLDVVLKLYKDLKPVPLDSDIKKLNNALNDFNTKLGDYIRYKEAKEGMTPENGYPEGYYSNTMKAQKDLTWRAFDRLDTAHQLKSLTELSLLPNVKSDVIEFALYNQQQRIMNQDKDDVIINPKKPDVLAVYNKTLANLRVQKNKRLRELAEASNTLSSLIGFSLSQDFLEEGHAELQAYNSADDLLVDAYDFETVKGKPVYSKEAQDKIYSDFAKCICNWTVHRYKDNDEYKAVENLDLSGFDSTEKMFNIDAKRLAESEEIKKLLPPEKLNPMAVINIVSDLPNLLGRFKEACGIDPATLLRRYQVERNAVTVGKVSVNLMPTDPQFDKQAMQDRIDGKVRDYGDIENFLNDEKPEIRPVEPFVRH